jgi:membrane protease YdiL (CAAX protease family)
MLYILLLIGSELISSILIYIFKINGLYKEIMLIITNIIATIAYLNIVKFNIKEEINKLKKLKSDDIIKLISIYIFSFILMVITNLIIVNFIKHGIAPNEKANREIMQNYKLYAIISMCIVTPILEETAFRYIFKDTFKKNITYIHFTGLLFSSMHVLISAKDITDLLYIVPYSTLGIAFSAIYSKSNKCILTSMIDHIIHNTLSIIVILL